MQFDLEKNGYRKEQVDQYVGLLATEYKKMQDGYVTLAGQYKEVAEQLQGSKEASDTLTAYYESQLAELNAKIQTTQSRPPIPADNEAAAKVLNEAKIMAQRIIDNANAEAAGIIEKARQEIEQAYQMRKQILDELMKINLLIESMQI